MESAETERPSRRTINVMNLGMWLIVVEGSGVVNFNNAAARRRLLVPAWLYVCVAPPP